MPRPLLDQLDELKTRFGPREGKQLNAILARLRQRKFTDQQELIHYHELLLFLRAYPNNASILRLVERELQTFAKRVDALREADADLSLLDSPEVSGVAGVPVSDTFTYYIVRWLVNLQPRGLSLDWDSFDDEYRLAETWPRFMPLLEEDAFVEANVPYDKWLRAATSRSRSGKDRAASSVDISWLIEHFQSLEKSDQEKAELYDSLKLHVRWSFSYRWTRTGMRLPRARQIFFHRGPLIQRRDVSLRRELAAPPPQLTKLSAKQGAAILDLTRAASTIRYRELYGFTHGDATRVLKVDLGRGVEVFIVGVPPGVRLPLRAYHAAMIFKNGVAVGYFEGISLFERMESGFNLYYTFRDGETAWLYARLLSVFHQLLGVTAFSIDPYQIGYENAEGIDSGAFWFYRKLGFRPTKPEIMKLVLREEQKLATRPGYRTSAATLRKLAEGPMIFELAEKQSGDWDRFSVRTIGLAATRHMAAKYRGDVKTFREDAMKALSRVLGVRTNDWRPAEREAFSNFAVTLSMVDDLNEWTRTEKQALLKIIRAKAGANESKYLKQMQQHARLRAAIIKLGS